MGLRLSRPPPSGASPSATPAAPAEAGSSADLVFLREPLVGSRYAGGELKALLGDVLDAIGRIRDNAARVRDDVLRRAERAAETIPGVAEKAAKLVIEIDAVEARKVSALESEAAAVEAAIVEVAKIREDASAACAPSRRATLAKAARDARAAVASLPSLPVAPFEPVVIGLAEPTPDDPLGAVVAPRALTVADVLATRPARHALAGRDARLLSLSLQPSYPTAGSRLEAEAVTVMLATHVTLEAALVWGAPAAVAAPVPAPEGSGRTAEAAAAVAGPGRLTLRFKLTPAPAQRAVDVTVAIPGDAPAGSFVEVSSILLGGSPLSASAASVARLPVVHGGLRAPLTLPGATSPFPCSPCVSELGELFAVATGRDDLPVYGPDGGAPLRALPLSAAGATSRMTCAAALCDSSRLVVLGEDDATDSRVIAIDADAIMPPPAAVATAPVTEASSESAPDTVAPGPSPPTLRWATEALGSDVLGVGVLPAQGLAVVSLRRTDRLLVLRLSDGSLVTEARAGHPEHVAVDAASGLVFVSVGMTAVEAFRWDEGAEGGRGALLPLGRVAAAGTTTSYRPMAVLPPPALLSGGGGAAPAAVAAGASAASAAASAMPGGACGGGGGVLVVGTYGTSELRVLSLPDLALLETLALAGSGASSSGEAVTVTGLAGDPSGRALVVCEGKGSEAAVRVLEWPLRPEARAPPPTADAA